MNVLFLETTNFSPHLETTFEISVDHLNNGDNVFYKFIGHAVFSNQLLVSRSRFIPDFCLPENIGINILKSESLNFENVFIFPNPVNYEVPEFSSLSDLKSFKYHEFEIGMSVYASLTFQLKDPYPDILKYRHIIVRMMQCAVQVYHYSVSQIEKYKPKIVYLFNGRFYENRAILAAAQACGCSYRIHERGASKAKYTLRSFRPHSVEGRIGELNEMVAQESIVSRISEDGCSYFFDRRSGVEQHWHSFRGRQDSSTDVYLFPPNSERRFVYFASSDDEIMSVSDIVDVGPFGSQINAINKLLDLLRRNPRWFLVVRLHPNMLGKFDTLGRWNSLDLPDNVVVVQPGSRLDSYKIMEASECTISFSSLMGIESVFWGVPSIVLGPSIFSGSDAVYTPCNLEQLEDLMSSPGLAVDPVKSHKFGYYLKNYGTDFSYYHAASLSQGMFLNKDLQQCGVCLLFRKFFKIVNWARSSLISQRNRR